MVKSAKNAEPRWRGILLALGSFGLLGLEGCALPDYQPPQNNETTSVGGASSSSSSSGGQGGAGGTTTSSSSSSSGNSGNEDCTNGVDDDGDDAVDCADSDCNAGYECVAPEPAGWIGLLRIHERDYAAPAQGCPAGTVKHNVPLYFAPWGAECTSCTCTPNVECMLPTITTYQAEPCATELGKIAPANGTLCAPLAAQVPVYVKMTPAVPKGDTCMGTTGSLVHQEAWQKQVDVCKVENAGGGCGSGNVCVPRSNPTYGTRACIAKDGTTSCPAGFSEAHTYAKSADDKRSCTACSCNAADVVCEGGGVAFNGTTLCGGENVPLEPGVCTKTDTSGEALKWTPAQAVVPAAACKQGAGTGAVLNNSPVTVCCAG